MKTEQCPHGYWELCKHCNPEFKPTPVAHMNGLPSEKQVGGNHYKDMKMQPMQFCIANRIGVAEGDAILYLCRWREKGGIEDLKKAIHSIELLIEVESE